MTQEKNLKFYRDFHGCRFANALADRHNNKHIKGLSYKPSGSKTALSCANFVPLTAAENAPASKYFLSLYNKKGQGIFTLPFDFANFSLTGYFTANIINLPFLPKISAESVFPAPRILCFHKLFRNCRQEKLVFPMRYPDQKGQNKYFFSA